MTFSSRTMGSILINVGSTQPAWSTTYSLSVGPKSSLILFLLAGSIYVWDGIAWRPFLTTLTSQSRKPQSFLSTGSRRLWMGIKSAWTTLLGIVGKTSWR